MINTPEVCLSFSCIANDYWGNPDFQVSGYMQAIIFADHSSVEAQTENGKDNFDGSIGV